MRLHSACVVAALVLFSVFAPACKRGPAPSLVAKGDTFAEMRAVKGEISVTPPGESKRAPYPRERLADGAELSLASGALAWIRRDAGSVWLVAGPAQLTLKEDVFKMTSGRAFIDGEDAPPVRIDSPRGMVELENARASFEVLPDGSEDVYVLRGAARAKNTERGSAGERLTLKADGSITRSPAVAWDDWTGGLATADPAAQPAPFGLGTVGARPPGDKGKPRFSLVIERLDVRVTVDHDFATTEVDQTFVNPSSDTVEGIFSFRTPPGAVLSKFGVDRDGDVVWGKVKESAAAQQQYESNVYQGSTEDPALLAWSGPGTYNARLYPIQPGAKRRVVTRYAEWLSRQGPKSDRRLYVYPMAAEGARGSLPRIEELRVTFDLAKSGASRVKAGMNGRTEGKSVVIQAFDFVPRADLAVELFDGGESDPVAYRAPHTLTAEDIPMNADSKFAAKVSSEEPDYLLVPLRSSAADAVGPSAKGVDLAIVVDTSAATEPGALAIARSLTSALLAHLGPDDRAALWAGDATLRPIGEGSGELAAVDANKRRDWLAGLAGVERGGATDIGALLTEAAGKLDTKRRGAVLYIGDGLPSVGEVTPKAIKDRLVRLPPTTRIFAAGIGTRANVALLDSIARGAPVETVGDAYAAARSALRLLEAAQRGGWVGATVDLGPGIERVLPRELPPVAADESVLVVGRIAGRVPDKVTLKSGDESASKSLSVVTIEDTGDLRRRWGQGRMQELLGEGAGRAQLVDIGRRFGLVSPYTSLYVPTKREVERGDSAEREHVAQSRAEAIERRRFWRPWSRSWRYDEAPEAVAASAADNKEGGTGTRAKGEEGSMGNPQKSRYASATQPAEDMAPAASAAAPAGMIGLLNAGAGGDPNQAPAAPPPVATAAPATVDRDERARPAAPKAARAPAGAGDPLGARGNQWADQIGDSFGAGGLGLSGSGEGGAGRGEGIGLGNIGTIGHGAGTGTGQGFGAGHGKLGGAHATKAPAIRQGQMTMKGSLPAEVIQRIVRQNFGRFRLCYEAGLQKNPNLSGTVTTKFTIDRSGAVSNTADAGSDMPDKTVVQCVVKSFSTLSFPQPDDGTVIVSYPLQMTAGDDAAPKPQAANTTTTVTVTTTTGPIGVIGHTARPCGPGAELPLSERRVLWGERLANASTSAEAALAVYKKALDDCEAPTWRERTTLLLQMVEQLKTVTARVALWKSLVLTPAADVVYRAIVVRVQSVAELHELHTALGLATVDPDMLNGMLAKVKTPAEKVGVLRAAAQKWPDDLELGLRVLDAYEDAGDDAGSRAWARRLRRRADATAHVWTSVGEHYLRLAAREQGADAERDRIEGRRTFGEIVEFAPEDPAARRRLGDLLRAHGWYDEALRQYMTLQTLTPDDPAVPLLIASAAQGLGRVEEAVGWAEKAAQTGSPDGTSPLSRAARATALAFIAWAREDALKNGKKEDAEKLLARGKRLLAAGGKAGNDGDTVRVLVSWSHPELHPTLWTNALGAPMPSPDNFLPFGISEAKLSGSPAKVEVRLEPEDAARAARLGAKAIVTVIKGAGTPGETIVKQELSFGTVAAPSTTLALSYDGSLTVTAQVAKPEKPEAKK
ncbi:MAG: AgmX/PglI C-terminal domain-containing protein [Labilithrix sp.]|nr:AgmX/PglI C-terminal domain-containing protein [Labilithrix sp.]MCW5813216.1 AgmX/PglI C-terminal domain-containing protein [Labilithrix sp.]